MATAMDRAELTVTRLDAPLGARIEGIDLSCKMSPALKQAVLEAWHAHIVLLFPGQEFSGDEQLAFAGEFGPSRLDNTGERLHLVDVVGVTIADFRYNDKMPWPTESRNEGA